MGLYRTRKGDRSSVCLYSTFTYIWLGSISALPLILTGVISLRSYCAFKRKETAVDQVNRARVEIGTVIDQVNRARV